MVDDDQSVRRSLRRLFVQAGFQVREFASPGDLLLQPPFGGDGCIVTDLRMPEMSGLAMQQRALLLGWQLPFLFISGHGDVTEAVLAMKAGALDFLQKPLDTKLLLEAVQRAIQKCRQETRVRQERDSAMRLVAQLSRRERQVCSLVAEGLLNKQIAARLGTSEKTVKLQRANAMRKLGATSIPAMLDLLRNAGPDA